MTVHCPHCLTGYLLPDHLLGDQGARVRCPGCEGVFAVLPETADARPAALDAGVVRADETPASVDTSPLRADETAAPDEVAPTEEPEAVAGSVLDVLADFLGDNLTRSRLRGTVLSDHGPAIMAGWDEYRRRVGASAPAGCFRAALRERCGVDLSRVNGG
jgi:predicted Zn finger-like uncharacterized protein